VVPRGRPHGCRELLILYATFTGSKNTEPRRMASQLHPSTHSVKAVAKAACLAILHVQCFECAIEIASVAFVVQNISTVQLEEAVDFRIFSCAYICVT